MPLIKAIRRWFGRRTEVTEPYVPVQPMAGGELGIAWIVVVIATLPILAFLVLIGLVYEGVIRVDRKRLGSILDWGIAAVLAAVIAIVLIGAVVRLLQSR